MVIVAGTVVVPSENHRAMEEAMLRLTTPTRAEEGCLEFEFWADLQRPARFHVFEIWASADALAAHLATPHLKAFRQERAHLGAEAVVRRFRAEELLQL